MSILFDLWLINHLLSGALDEVLVDTSGLTGEDFGFYSLLRRFGPLTPTQVSRWTAMPATTVSATVRRLAARGHVEQVRNPADGRSRLIALTDAGVATHAATAAVFFTQTRPLATALGPDEHQQRLSLQRLDAALRQVSGLDPRPYASPPRRRGTVGRPAVHRRTASAAPSHVRGSHLRNCPTWDRPSARTRRTRSAPTSISSAADGSEELMPHQSSRNPQRHHGSDAFSGTARRLMAEHQVPGLSIAVTSSSGLVYAGAFGDADLAEHRATTTDTRFLWFSMSKIVTATAALRLADEGRLDLDAPVRSVVPTFAARAGHTQPRIRQLLNHTAGAANPLPLRWVQPAGRPPAAARDKVAALAAAGPSDPARRRTRPLFESGVPGPRRRHRDRRRRAVREVRAPSGSRARRNAGHRIRP